MKKEMIICIFFREPVSFIADGKQVTKTDFIYKSKRIDTKFQMGFIEVTSEDKSFVFRVDSISSMCQYLTD